MTNPLKVSTSKNQYIGVDPALPSKGFNVALGGIWVLAGLTKTQAVVAENALINCNSFEDQQTALMELRKKFS